MIDNPNEFITYLDLYMKTQLPLIVKCLLSLGCVLYFALNLFALLILIMFLFYYYAFNCLSTVTSLYVGFSVKDFGSRPIITSIEIFRGSMSYYSSGEQVCDYLLKNKCFNFHFIKG